MRFEDFKKNIKKILYNKIRVEKCEVFYTQGYDVNNS